MASSWTPDSTTLPINQGYAVTTPDISPDSGGEVSSGANARLIDRNNNMIGLWIHEVTADFELAGSVAQSARRRQFFPHNFTQPSLTFAGQTTNSFQYNRLAEFVRQSHLDVVTNGVTTDGTVSPLRLLIVSSDQPDTPRRNIRGNHGAVDISGYIKSVTRGAERYVNAPEYTLEFVFLDVHAFLGLEGDQSQIDLANSLSILDVIQDKDFHYTFLTAPKKTSQVKPPAKTPATPDTGEVTPPPAWDPSTIGDNTGLLDGPQPSSFETP